MSLIPLGIDSGCPVARSLVARWFASGSGEEDSCDVGD